MEIRPGSRPAHNGSEEQLDNRHQASDENLVGRLHAGDEEALTELYARYPVRALHYFQKMLGDLETAQDALQDLFLKLIDARASICVDRKFASWLFAVAHHMCCNEYRSRDVRSRAMTRLVFEADFASPDRMEDRIDDRIDDNLFTQYLEIELRPTGHTAPQCLPAAPSGRAFHPADQRHSGMSARDGEIAPPLHLPATRSKTWSVRPARTRGPAL